MSEQEIETLLGDGVTVLELSLIHIYSYLDDLLTYGNAVGEMVPFCEGEGIAALYNVPLENILIRQGEDPLDVKLFANSRMGEAVELAHPERVLYTALNPKAGSVQGRSLLEGQKTDAADGYFR